jgi:hypothetical protein
MEEINKPNQWQYAAKFGLLLGLALIVFSLILYVLDIDSQGKIGYVNYLILIAGLAIGIINFRDKVNGGYISYGKSVGYGVQLALFSGIILSFYLFIFFSFIDPEYIGKMLIKIEDAYYDASMDEDQIETAMVMMKKFYTPTSLSIFSVLGNVLMGLIFSLILSIFLKKESSSFEDDLS